MRAADRWTRVSAMAAPGAWTHRVGMNLATSWLRRRQAERRAHARAGAGDAPAPTADLADAIVVREAVLGLPARQRTVLGLRYYADLSVAETAAAMGLSEDAVKAHTRRAVAALRGHLAPLTQARPAMTDDVRGLVAQAVLEPDTEPPVAELVRRAGRRRRRRHASLGLTGLMIVGVVAATVAGLGVTRVDLAPAGPSPQSGGWPLDARFEIIDLDYGEFVQQPRDPVVRTVEELAAASWETWTQVHVAMYELRPGGQTRVGDANPVHVSRATPEWDEVGTVDVRDATAPFAALEAARDAVLGERIPRNPAISPVVPGRVLAPAPEGPPPGVQVVDGDATAVRDRVAEDLDLDAGELQAVVTVEEFCGAQGAFIGRCGEPEVRVERTFVHHAPTGLPLYRSWRPVDGMPDELAALGLDELVELRATHVRLSKGEAAAPEPPAGVLDPGEADDAGVVVELDRSTVTPGESITVTMTHAGGRRLHTGAGFTLERSRDGEWQQVAGAHDQIRGPRRSLHPGGSVSNRIDTSALAAGRYRFTTGFMTAEGEQCPVTAEFEVIDP